MKRIHFLSCMLLCALALACLNGCQRTVVQRKLAIIEESKKLFPVQGTARPFLKAHMKNGEVHVLKEWSFNDSSSCLLGTGSLLDLNRSTVKAGKFSIKYSDVAIIESNTLDSKTIPLGGLVMMTGLTGVGAIYCATNPKACFGSCPTFYAWDGSKMALMAEGFPASIAPALEAEDVDALSTAKPFQRVLLVRVKNEALETHVIKDVRIAALPRPRRGHVFKTASDEFLQATSLTLPSRVLACGQDQTPLFLAADGREYYSLADSLNLAVPETLDIQFASPPSGEIGLVVTSRQTLMTTFLLYQTLAYMGEGVGYWLAELERGGTDAQMRATAYGRILGKIEILVQDGRGDWSAAGSVGETGPIASDSYVVPLGVARAGSPYNLKVRMTKGFWRIDCLALAALGQQAKPVMLEPQGVLCLSSRNHPVGTQLQIGPAPLVQFPGDECELTFLLPEENKQYELFIVSRGYYLEWIRSEWILEESPDRIVEFLTDPSGYLMTMAPLFKKAEPTMEEQFWNSRYEKAQ
jgi:hypothetical protein